MPIIRVNQKVGYFVHIPRCAGSSIEHYLDQVCESVGLVDGVYFSHPRKTLWNRSSPQHIDSLSLSRLFPKSNFFDFTFAVVRHPYTRFMSAFKFQRDREKTIAPETSPEDFVRRIHGEGVESMEPGWMDNHFLPMSNFVPPGAILRVFKIEDGLEPFHQWFEREVLAKPSGAAIPHINREITLPDRGPDRALSEDTKRMLFEIYEKDFQNFRYSPGL